MLDEAAESGQQRFTQIHDGARQAMVAHRTRCDAFWQSSRKGIATTLSTTVESFDTGLSG